MSLAVSLIPLCVVVLCAIYSVHTLKPIPDFIHVCKANDPHLNDCIVQSIEQVRPFMKTGIPEMDVPSVEPLAVGNLLVTKRATQNGLQVMANDIRAYNASQFVVTKMDVVEHGHIYKFDVLFKTMYVTGTYSIDGRILLLPISGSGNFTATFRQAISHNLMVFEKDLHADDGIEYIRVANFETRIKLKQGSIRLQNLFNGDKMLGDVINDTINENFALFAEDLIPLVERALNKVFKRIGNNVCQPFAWSQFFPLS